LLVNARRSFVQKPQILNSGGNLTLMKVLAFALNHGSRGELHSQINQGVGLFVEEGIGKTKLPVALMSFSDSTTILL